MRVVHSDNFYLIVGVFSSVSFNIIIDMLECGSTVLLFVFFSSLFSVLLFSLSSLFWIIRIIFEFHFNCCMAFCSTSLHYISNDLFKNYDIHI